MGELNCSARETKEGEISALHLACNHGHLDIMEFLIGRGADLEKVSVYGKPLNWAVGSSQQEAARLLLERGPTSGTRPKASLPSTWPSSTPSGRSSASSRIMSPSTRRWSSGGRRRPKG